MQVAYFSTNHIEMREKDKPAVQQGEALVKVSMSGICNTDIELYKGYYNFSGVAGHEFTGRVEECPDIPELIGLRVVADINCGCNSCHTCACIDPRHCSDRSTIGIMGRDGAFAEYVTVPVENLHIVSSAVSDAEAVFVEPLAAALEPSQQILLTNSTSLLVLGDGKLGLLSALGLRHYCPETMLVGKHADKLAIAEKQGVKTERFTSADMVDDLIREYGQFDVVVEATGRADGVCYAMDLVRPEGTIIAKTTTHEPARLDLSKLVVNEINLLGSRCGDVGLALSYLEKGLVDVLPLVDAVYDFSDFENAFAHALKPGTKKILLNYEK